VVDDQVHQQLHAALVQRRDQRVQVLERAEQRVDVPVVADVVAVVVLRRPVDRRQPEHVHAEVARWSSLDRTPRRSPTPSPSESAKLRG
jgi:hypothetical protein